MKKLIIKVVLLVVVVNNCFAQKKEQQIEDVKNFIECIRKKDAKAIASTMHFPFSREYPIPDIKNKQEFVARFNELFDDSLRKVIVNSNPATDWSEVGWRGIMLHVGSVWLNDEGALIAVNYQSEFERKLKKKLIAEEKEILYPSIKNFVKPILLLKTKNYTIRVDELSEYKYRYASWKLGKKMNEKPDIIIESGEYIWEGTGGNHRYRFKNAEYTYECEVIVMGSEEDPPARLVVLKNEEEVFSQAALIIRR